MLFIIMAHPSQEMIRKDMVRQRRQFSRAELLFVIVIRVIREACKFGKWVFGHLGVRGEMIRNDTFWRQNSVLIINVIR